MIALGGFGRNTPETLYGPVSCAAVSCDNNVITMFAPEIGVPSTRAKVPVRIVVAGGSDIVLPMIFDFRFRNWLASEIAASCKIERRVGFIRRVWDERLRESTQQTTYKSAF